LPDRSLQHLAHDKEIDPSLIMNDACLVPQVVECADQWRSLWTRYRWQRLRPTGRKGGKLP